MPTEDEWTFPSAMAAINAQHITRRYYQGIRSARGYACGRIESYAALITAHMDASRIASRFGREHLFALIGDGTLEDCPPTWKW